MCKFYSCIITRKGKVLDDIDNGNSHETVVSKYKLKDNKLKDRDFVRIEINPLNYEKLTKRFSKKQWKYKVDEQGTLPDWYLKDRKKLENQCWDKLKKIYKEKFIFKGEVVVKKGRVWLYNSSSAVLYNSSSAVLYNSSSAELYDSSSAKLFNSSSAELQGSSSAVLYGSSSAKLYDSSSAVLFSSSSAGLFNSSSAKLYGSSSAKLYDSSAAELWDSSSAKLWDKTQAVIYSCKEFKQSGGKTAVIDRRENKVKTIIK